MKKTILFLLLVLISIPTHAAITFTDGKWETSFNGAGCTDGTSQANSPAGNFCDGVTWDGGGTFTGMPATGSVFLTSANNPLGTGQAFRYYCTTGQNYNTWRLRIELPSAQTELWIRWYLRYESGFGWDPLSYDKNFWLWTPGGGYAIPEPNGTSYLVGMHTGAVVTTSGTWGWYQMMGNSNAADGQWHCYEVHLTSAGVVQFWFDGVLKLNSSGNDMGAPSGWIYLDIPGNQHSPTGTFYKDVDDIVIYNTTPPGRDAGGNPYIGPIGTPTLRKISGAGAFSN